MNSNLKLASRIKDFFLMEKTLMEYNYWVSKQIVYQAAIVETFIFAGSIFILGYSWNYNSWSILP